MIESKIRKIPEWQMFYTMVSKLADYSNRKKREVKNG